MFRTNFLSLLFNADPLKRASMRGLKRLRRAPKAMYFGPQARKQAKFSVWRFGVPVILRK